MTTLEIMQGAKLARQEIAAASTETKNQALLAMASALEAGSEEILAANALDMQAAEGKLTPVMMDRLLLTEERIRGMAEGIREVVQLLDPVGEVRETVLRPNGLKIEKTLCPMGVIAIIYESRPNVTADAAALCLKSGNSCVLRCGKEAWRTSNQIIEVMRRGLEGTGIPAQTINLLQDTSHSGANELMTATDYIDLLIPRGGAGLIRACVENAKVPCIRTGTGICHVYVDADADLDMALNIITNAKTSRPSVCNAEEVCLVNSAVAEKFLPMLKRRLVEQRAADGQVPVELRLDRRASAIISGTPAGEKDFDTEFLNYILAVGIVDSVEEAIGHIAMHSTGHSEAIVTRDERAAKLFAASVDSAAVYINASTRFTDGGEFGLGCEIGISTQKLHARGPMGLRELCTSKYIVHGNGQIR